MKHILLSLLLLFTIPAFAQRIVSAKPYGTTSDDEIIKVIPTYDKGHLVVAFNAHCYYLMKFDSNYDNIWTKNYYGDNLPFDVTETFNHNFLIAGTGPNEPWIFSINDKGDSLWSRKYYQWKPTYFDRSIQLSDSSFLLRFYYDVTNRGLLNINAKGDSLWNIKLTPIDILPIKDTFIAINQTYFRKYANNGKPALDKTLKLKHGIGSISTLNEGGGYVLLGDGIGLSKLNNDGDTLWSRLYTESDAVVAAAVKETLDSGFLAFGTLNDNLYLLKVDKNGNKQWRYQFPNPFDKETASYLSLNCDSSITLFGYAKGGPIGGEDIFLIKMDSMKNVHGTCVRLTGIQEPIKSEEFITIFPNPAHNILNITSEIPFPTQLKILNSLGQEVSTLILSSLQQIAIPVENFTVGLYLIELKEKNGITHSEKFIKY